MAGKKTLFSADAAEEYFSTLLIYYRNTGNDIFKRDNEGRHASDQIYSAEYQKYLGMQIAMREVLEYFDKFELGDTALRQQETVTKCNDLYDEDGGEILKSETVTNRSRLNEPLTLDELRKMDGEPVYCVEITGREEWLFRRDGGFADMYGEFASDDFMVFDNYGKLWWCYRQKPEEDDHG